MAAVEAPAVQSEQLDRACNNGDQEGRSGEAGEAGHSMDEVLVARPGEHDPGEQHEATEPDRHGEGVGRTHRPFDEAELVAAEGHRDHGENGSAEGDCLVGRVDRPVRPEHRVTRGGNEDEAQQGCHTRCAVEQVAPPGGHE